jgi:hypothetical protein
MVRLCDGIIELSWTWLMLGVRNLPLVCELIVIGTDTVFNPVPALGTMLRVAWVFAGVLAGVIAVMVIVAPFVRVAGLVMLIKSVRLVAIVYGTGSVTPDKATVSVADGEAVLTFNCVGDTVM